MPNEVVNYQCPACGAPLRYAPDSGRLVCDYCGSDYDPETIERELREKSEQAAAVTAAEPKPWTGMRVYSCPSCGAELICDENTAATCCPYCGNQTVIPGQLSGGLEPEFVIPFKTTKQDAVSALKEHYKGKRLLPGSFVDENHIQEIQGVYVPFWMFDCTASGRVEYKAENSDTRRQGDREITTTRHYRVLRAGSLRFEMVPADASTRMPDEHMDSIEPFDYSELRPFTASCMPGFLADRYDVEPKDCLGRITERCEDTFLEKMRDTVEGYDSVTQQSRSVAVESRGEHYAMLPVWLLSTKWKDENYLFAMNGQTGRLVGDLPMDKGKFWGWFGGIAAVLVGLMQLLNFFVFSRPLTGFVYGFFTIAMPIFIAFLPVLSMKGKLKSVHTRAADAYVDGFGLCLTVQKDIHTNTTTSVRDLSDKNKDKN